MLYPVKKGAIYLHLLPGKYAITEWSRPRRCYGRISWKLDISSGKEGGVYIGNIISNMDTRDYTLSIEDNALSGREVLKQ